MIEYALIEESVAAKLRRVTQLDTVEAIDKLDSVMGGSGSVPAAFPFIEEVTSPGQMAIGQKKQIKELSFAIPVVSAGFISRRGMMRSAYDLVPLVEDAMAGWTPGYLEIGSGASGLHFFAHKITRGSTLSVTFVVAGNSTPLSVSVSGDAVTVNVATDGAGLPTSTAAQVKTAVLASAPAIALVNVQFPWDETGTGVVAAGGGALTMCLKPFIPEGFVFTEVRQNRVQHVIKIRTSIQDNH